jgi:hypothetical protein
LIDASYFDRYRKLLELPNVHYHHLLPNKGAIDLIREIHFEMLVTFSDTFGYSAIEAIANFTPVIATRWARYLSLSRMEKMESFSTSIPMHWTNGFTTKPIAVQLHLPPSIE